MGIEHLSASARNVWALGQARDLTALPAALVALDADDRAALTGLLETWSKTVPDNAAAPREPSDSLPDEFPDEPDRVEATWNAAAVLAVGVCPGVTSAAAILRRVRRNLPYVWRFPAQAVAEVGADRKITWLPQLVDRLIPGSAVEDGTDWWRDLDALLTACGAPAPAAPEFTQGWLNARNRYTPWNDLEARADWVERSPYRLELLPRIFDIDGLYCPEGLAVLARRAPVYRVIMLDGCLRRILNGGTAPRLVGFGELWQELAPTPDEVQERLATYIAVVGSGAPGLARIAHQHLEQLDDDHRLSLDDLLDLAEVTLPRPQQPLVKAHLELLRRAAGRYPDRVAEIVAVIEPVTQHSKPGVQTMAAQILAQLGRALPAPLQSGLTETVVATRDAVAQEAVDERAARALRFLADEEPTEPAGSTGPAGSLARRYYRLTNLTGLVEQVMEVRESGRNQAWSPTATDMVLDAIHRLRAEDPSALVEALVGRMKNGFLADGLIRHPVGQLMHAELTAVIEVGGGSGQVPHHEIDDRVARNAAAIAELTRAAARGEGPRPGWLRVVGVSGLRLVELADRAAGPGSGWADGLPATPSHGDGRIEPAVLLDRLAAAEQAGDRPGPIELDAALLRTTRSVPAELSERAEALAGPAGPRLAAWWSSTPAAELGGLIGLLLTVTPPDPVALTAVSAEWQAALPHHPEAAAYWSGPPHPVRGVWPGWSQLSPVHDPSTGLAPPELLEWIFESATRSRFPDPAAAQDRLAAHLVVDPALGPVSYGLPLGRAIRTKELSLQRILPVLSGVAERSPEPMWTVLTVALPDILRSGNSGAARVVEMIEDLARHLHRVADVPALATAAKGRSKLAEAARALIATFEELSPTGTAR